MPERLNIKQPGRARTPFGGGGYFQASGYIGIGDPNVYGTGSTGGGAGHSHTISSTSSLPPYYALAYIMKL